MEMFNGLMAFTIKRRPPRPLSECEVKIQSEKASNFKVVRDHG